MPFINTKTNVKIDTDKELYLKEAFAKAIELIPGKSERWLMLNFSDCCRMHLAGSDAPLAMLEVEIFGKASPAAYDALTKELTDIVNEALSIPPDRIYVKYEEIDTWGWNGDNF